MFDLPCLGEGGSRTLPYGFVWERGGGSTTLAVHPARCIRPMPAEPTSVRATVWEWLITGLLVANLAWTTLCLGGFRPETMVVTSAVNGLLLALHFGRRACRREKTWPVWHPAGWWLLPFLAYAAANVLWVSPVPWLGWKDWLGWAQMIVVFWIVLNDVRAKPTRTLLFGGLVAVAFVAVTMACYQRFAKPHWLMLGRVQAEQFIGRASGSFGIPNSLAALLLLLVPALGVLTFQRGARAVQRVICGYLTLALALVLALWPIFAARGSFVRRLGWTALAGLGVAVVAVMLYFSLPKVRERFVMLEADAGEKTRPIMWRGAWQIFREQPVWGSGAGSYNVRFEKFRPERYQDEPQWAHNDYLNTLSDYGVVGFVLFFDAGGLLAWRSSRQRTPQSRDWLDDRAVAGALTAGAVAFALQLFVDFHFKIPALAMAFAIVAALLIQRAWPAPMAVSSSPTLRKRLGNYVASSVVVVATALRVVPFYQAEALRYAARQSINQMATDELTRNEQRVTLTRARADLSRAVEIYPGNAQAWADLSYVSALWFHLEPALAAELGRQAENMANRALAESQMVPEFWVRRGVGLDLQGRWSDAGSDFSQALRLAPASGSIWFYHAFHLGLNPACAELAEAAAGYCLRLDPDNRQAQALRQRLATSLQKP